jgi:NADH:ubiquinone oxidoreductase subunit 5 (subunit L)/multisubunit Na+/H+ antiporter MnhA subunit
MKREVALRTRNLYLYGTIIALLILAAILVAGCSSQDATGAAIAGLAVVWVCVIVVACLVGVFLFVVWLIMLIDCARRSNTDFPNATESTKIMWLLIIILTSGIGAIIYYFMVRRKMPRKA